MTEIKKIKDLSPLAESILALDQYFASLSRLSVQIDESDIISDFEMDRTQQLMKRFSEVGEQVSAEIINFAKVLNECQANAEAAAKVVSEKAMRLHERKEEHQKKLQAFQQLSEKVQKISSALSEVKSPEDQALSEADRLALSQHLGAIGAQLQPIIDEANNLKNDAKNLKMKIIERDADSLSQSLQAVSSKLSGFSTPVTTH